MHVANATALGFSDGVVSDVEEDVVVSRLATDGAFEPPHPAARKPRETASAARPTTSPGNRESLKRL
jgi:hypothetical protein